MSEFRRVGAEVPFGEVYITPEEIEPIRYIASLELLEAVPSTIHEQGNGIENYVRYSVMHRAGDHDWTGVDQHLTISLGMQADTDSWQARIFFRTYY